MYCWSPASTRLALGPGRSVLILGPLTPGRASVIVLVVMESSEKRWPVVGERNVGTRGSGSSTRGTLQSGGGFVSRYRRGWDAGETADSPDSAVDTPGSAASTRADANWICCEASRTLDITKPL